MISRRALLQLLGLSGAAAAAYCGLPGALRPAFADTPGPARRLIVISHCHGFSYDTWKLRPAGLAEDQPWSVDLNAMAESEFSPVLAPLYPYRRRLLALDGLSLSSAELDGDGNRHDRGFVHAWTGNKLDASGSTPRSTSASIDQLVAAHIARPDRLPSMELSVDAGLEVGRPISYGPSGNRLPVESMPIRAWQRAFGAAVGEGVGARGRAGLDHAYAEYQALAPKLDAAERTRLEAHYELVRNLGARLDGLSKLECALPPRPAESFALYDPRFDAFADVITASLACDVTRVVTLSLGEMLPSEFGAEAISDKVHKGIAHDIYNDPVKYQAMTKYFTRHAQQVARLVARIEAIPDPAGGSLMDSTLIVWGSELGDAWHGYRYYCPLLIGGSWALGTGRYMHWPHATPVELLVPATIAAGGRTQVAGIPHQKMLVSVAHAMGLDSDHVGLEHVRGQRGDFIDLKGPLEGLKG